MRAALAAEALLFAAPPSLPEDEEERRKKTCEKLFFLADAKPASAPTENNRVDRRFPGRAGDRRRYSGERNGERNNYRHRRPFFVGET